MRTSFDLSTVASLRSLANVVKIVTGAASAIGRRCMIVGATARDLILHHAHGLPERRKTVDLDIAVAIDGWETFERLMRALSDRGAVHGPAAHTFAVDGWRVDVVPFGVLEQNGTIAWPPDGATVMTVLGFAEASEHAFDVKLPGDVIVKVASPAGLLLLKVIAWRDRHRMYPRRDGVDIRTLIDGYAAKWNQDRLYEEADDLLQTFEYDIDLAAAAFLGRDAAAIAKRETLREVVTIVEQQTRDDVLTLASDMGARVEQNLSLLEALLVGLDPQRMRSRPNT